MNTLLIEQHFSEALKSVARREDIKAYIKETPLLYSLLSRAAGRYVAGDVLEDGLNAGTLLRNKGYNVSLEYIGENIRMQSDCEQAVKEFLKLIRACGETGAASRISLDLSHIGLSINPQLAYNNLILLAKEAVRHSLTILISMEEAAKTDLILSVYKQAIVHCSNLGITLQAHLYRTPQDLETLLPLGGCIRIVKGAYQESALDAMPRSKALNDQFSKLVARCIQAGCSISAATHDDALITEMRERGYFDISYFELEMLYGIRPELSSNLHAAGFPVRIYLTYGEEWYLYICHRIAEFPPNVYLALTDIIQSDTKPAALYA
ncbi:proline dehydrogenase family protein [Paenibacillus sp. UNC451MF]|uniref:proline dehydrogenase family protein n=1 Tax=Paenibacillus sp. UNC451MF TaxID=1449063 RepID=UPI00048D9E44|nr:proline dehydrogenase family protein [Paenibacillus sp. UNC451MF]